MGSLVPEMGSVDSLGVEQTCFFARVLLFPFPMFAGVASSFSLQLAKTAFESGPTTSKLSAVVHLRWFNHHESLKKSCAFGEKLPRSQSDR